MIYLISLGVIVNIYLHLIEQISKIDIELTLFNVTVSFLLHEHKNGFPNYVAIAHKIAILLQFHYIFQSFKFAQYEMLIC